MRLQDVLISMLQSSVSCRAVNLEEEHGCVSMLMHLSRTYDHIVRLSPSLQQLIQLLPLVAQARMSRQLQQLKHIAVQSQRHDASKARRLKLLQRASCTGDLQPDGAAELHAAARDVQTFECLSAPDLQHCCVVRQLHRQSIPTWNSAVIPT